MLDRFSDPECVFCAYNKGIEHKPEPATDLHKHIKLISGSEFLYRYLSQDLDVLGVYGGFRTDYLRRIGGIKQLGDGFGPYSDTLLAIRAGKLDKIGYIDTPLVFFRTHDQSISFTSPEVTSYTSAQMDLISTCNEIFMDKRLSKHFRRNMFLLLMWCSRDIYTVLRRNSFFWPRGIIDHLKVLLKSAEGIGFYFISLISFNIWCASKYIAGSLLRGIKRYVHVRGENS